MNMTYAAQVRSMSKSLPKHSIQDDLYDVNSLRIICQYFVGNIVVVTTADELLEGVLHTISNNTVCLTLVTTSKLDNPNKIIKMSHSKLVSLNNVLRISTKDCGKYSAVTVKGKSIDIMKEALHFNSVPNGIKPLVKSANNGVKKLNGSVQSIKKTPVMEKQIEAVIIDKENLREEISVADNNIDEDIKCELQEDNKKSFSFNPNAPEFKPRSVGIFPEPIIFSPAPQQFQPVFTSNSAPAIFVPNVFFYAPNQHGMDVSCMDPNVPLHASMTGATEYHVPNNILPYAPVMPVFQHPVPIFIPNSQFQLGSNGHVYNAPEEAIVTDGDNEPDRMTVHIDSELCNPSHWPPLPSATVASAENKS